MNLLFCDFVQSYLDKAANVRKLIINCTDLVVNYTLLGYLIQFLGCYLIISERRISNQFYPLGSSEFKRGLKPPEFSREHKTDQNFFILIKAQSPFCESFGWTVFLVNLS